jgi:hypothetical protein
MDDWSLLPQQPDVYPQVPGDDDDEGQLSGRDVMELCEEMDVPRVVRIFHRGLSQTDHFPWNLPLFL